MKVLSLQSGSSGNCTYVEAGAIRLLFDAGISGQQAALRLAAHGIDIRQVHALIVSHDHRDHSRCLGVYQRKFGLPIYVTKRTLAAAGRYQALGALRDVVYFATGSTLQFGSVTVETIPTPHDGADGAAFIVDDGRTRVGILTDLGHVFADLTSAISTLDAVVLESNFEPHLLEQSAYPETVRRRIRGPRGHLSNQDAGELLAQAGVGRLQWACLAHLSDESNEPEVALATCRQFVSPSLSLFHAPRDGVSPLLEVVGRIENFSPRETFREDRCLLRSRGTAFLF